MGASNTDCVHEAHPYFQDPLVQMVIEDARNKGGDGMVLTVASDAVGFLKKIPEDSLVYINGRILEHEEDYSIKGAMIIFTQAVNANSIVTYFPLMGPQMKSATTKEEKIALALRALKSARIRVNAMSSKDFEKLRTQEFEVFNVHKLDDISAELQDAINEIEEGL